MDYNGIQFLSFSEQGEMVQVGMVFHDGAIIDGEGNRTPMDYLKGIGNAWRNGSLFKLDIDSEHKEECLKRLMEFTGKELGQEFDQAVTVLIEAQWSEKKKEHQLAEIYLATAMAKFQDFYDYLFNFYNEHPEVDLLGDYRDSILNMMFRDEEDKSAYDHYETDYLTYNGCHIQDMSGRFVKVAYVEYQERSTLTKSDIFELTDEELASIPKELSGNQKAISVWVINNVESIRQACLYVKDMDEYEVKIRG